MMNKTHIKQLAKGDWQYILSLLGVDNAYLTGKHCPCPFCGGKDRYRFTDWQGDGGFICNQCHPQGGDGFALLMMATGRDFKTALDDVASVLGLSDSVPKTYTPIAPKAPNFQFVDDIDKLQATWQQSLKISKDSPIASYLMARGLEDNTFADICPHALRYSPQAKYWHKSEAWQCIGIYPAMTGAIRNNNGDLMGLHQTYLKPTNGGYSKLDSHPYTSEAIPSKKMKARYSGSLRGCAVQLWLPESDILALTEGIESALAVRELTGLPVWACLSANGLACFDIPNHIKKLEIYIDNDENGTGIRAGASLQRRALETGIEANIYKSEQIGDPLDALLDSKGGSHEQV